MTRLLGQARPAFIWELKNPAGSSLVSRSYYSTTAQGATVTMSAAQTGWYTFRIRSYSPARRQPETRFLAQSDLYCVTDMNVRLTLLLLAALAAPARAQTIAAESFAYSAGTLAGQSGGSGGAGHGWARAEFRPIG